MLDEFIIKDDKNRKKVLDCMQHSKYNIEKFKIEEYNDYPGGMALIDKKNRKIIFYYDYLLKRMMIIYEKLHMIEKDVKDFISDMWTDYSIHAEENNLVARFKRKDGNITFYRYKFVKEDKTEIVHESKTFDEENEKYDIYFYLERECKEMYRKTKK